MALFDPAFNFVMDFEDPQRQYASVPDAPPGARSISGINSTAYPTQFRLIASQPSFSRAGAVYSFYLQEFWNKWLVQIADQSLANRVFDAAVNMGPGTSVGILQRAVAQAGDTAIQVDNLWGPDTVRAANACDAATLLEAFREVRAAHYRTIAASNPARAQYLGAWLKRAAA